MRLKEIATEEKGKLIIEVTVDSVRVDRALDRVFRKVAQEVNIPGFRRGKIPRKVLIARVGQELFNAEAKEILVNDGFEQAIRELGIEPLGVEIDESTVEAGKEYVFKMDIEVPPDVELKNYKGITVNRVPEVATQEMIQGEIDNLREKHAQLEPHDGPLENGLFAVVDYDSTMDDQPFEGGMAKDSLIEIGGGAMLPGFEENLEGLKKGDSKSFDLLFPEDYHHEPIRGKTANFTVSVKEIKKKVLPQEDDNFAKDLGQFETMAQLKEDMEERLNDQLKRMSQRNYEFQIIESIASESDIRPPEKMIARKLEDEIEEQEKAFKSRFADGDFDAFLAWRGTSRDGLREELRPRAAAQAKADLVLAAIIKAENIKVEEDEIRSGIQNTATAIGKSVDEMYQFMQKRGTLAIYEKKFAMKKAMDLIFSSAVYIDMPKDEGKAVEGKDDKPVEEKEDKADSN